MENTERKPFEVNEHAIFLNNVFDGPATFMVVELIERTSQPVKLQNPETQEITNAELPAWRVRLFNGTIINIIEQMLYHIEEKDIYLPKFYSVIQQLAPRLLFQAAMDWSEWYQINTVFRKMVPVLYGDEQAIAKIAAQNNTTPEVIQQDIDRAINGDLTGIKEKPSEVRANINNDFKKIKNFKR